MRKRACSPPESAPTKTSSCSTLNKNCFISSVDKLDVKEDRLKMLEETDFYGFSDVTMSSEMATYRQALRDLPEQEGFPDTITWPTKPS